MGQVEPEERDEATAPLERWTHDGVRQRDLTWDRHAADRARRELGRFADDLRALGFRELGIEGSCFQEELDFEVDEEALADARRAEAEGEPGGAERAAWLSSLRDLQDYWGEEQLAWLFVHSDTGDLAALERAGEEHWLSFTRYWADGSLARTIRRPDGAGRGAPEVTGAFLDARIPGLHRLVCVLAGDQLDQNHAPKPRLRHWDHVVGCEDVAGCFAAHVAWAEAHAPDAPVVVPTMAQALALSRRTLHVAVAGNERVGRIATALLWGFGLLGALGAFAAVASETGAGWGFLSLLVVPRLAVALWAVGTGHDGWLRPIPSLLLVGLLGYGSAVGLGPLGAALGLSLVATAAGRLVFLWLGQRGRYLLDPRQSWPPPVPVEELELRYRP